MPFEEERDRPNLGYIKGDKRSLVVDAGHSEAHIREFYDLLCKEGLPLPSLTVLTHWHWDHTFAMHAVKGLTIANKTTNGHLLECIKKIEKSGPDAFLNMFMCVKIKRYLLVMLPVRNFLTVPRIKTLQKNWLTKSA